MHASLPSSSSSSPLRRSGTSTRTSRRQPTALSSIALLLWVTSVCQIPLLPLLCTSTSPPSHPITLASLVFVSRPYSSSHHPPAHRPLVLPAIPSSQPLGPPLVHPGSSIDFDLALIPPSASDSPRRPSRYHDNPPTFESSPSKEHCPRYHGLALSSRQERNHLLGHKEAPRNIPLHHRQIVHPARLLWL